MRARALDLFLCESARHAYFQSGTGLPCRFARVGADGYGHGADFGDEDVFLEGLRRC